MEQPKVSVLMPVYNNGPYLDQAIQSLLGQSYTNFEVILINDGSTDDSKSCLDQWSRRDARLRVIHQSNQGLTASLNEAAKLATGKYLARMDGDDICEPERFELQVARMQACPELAAVGAWSVRIDQDGLPFGVRRWETDRSRLKQRLLEGKGGLCHPLAMIRKSAFEQVGGYDTRFQTSQDKLLWLRLLQVGPLENLPDCLLRYRVHGQSISQARSAQQAADLQQIVAEARRKHGLPDLKIKTGKVVSTRKVNTSRALSAYHNGFSDSATVYARRALAAGELAGMGRRRKGLLQALASHTCIAKALTWLNGQQAQQPVEPTFSPRKAA